jgi:hypothetical protein
MSEIALLGINSFASVTQQADVQPPEEPIFVLTGSQLKDIISRSIQEATEPLYQEIAYDIVKGSQSLSKESHSPYRGIEERSLEH